MINAIFLGNLRVCIIVIIICLNEVTCFAVEHIISGCNDAVSRDIMQSILCNDNDIKYKM